MHIFAYLGLSEMPNGESKKGYHFLIEIILCCNLLKTSFQELTYFHLWK